MQVAEAMRHAEAQLRMGPHGERARMDAEAILMHVIGKNRAWLLAHGDDERFLAHSMAYRTDGAPRIEYQPVRVTRWEPKERTY